MKQWKNVSIVDVCHANIPLVNLLHLQITIIKRSCISNGRQHLEQKNRNGKNCLGNIWRAGRSVKGLLVHRHIKSKQDAHMTKILSSCDGESILLQVDFSENASLISQDEIQSAYLSNNQAILLVTHARIKDIR